jgi:signal transduction histidine kinase
VILEALTALEQVRQAFAYDPGAALGEGVTGAEALDLFAEVVHDLRSPLTSILCLAETLQRARSGPVNRLQERQLGLIYSAALGLSGVVNDALELARGDDLAEDEPSPLSLCELLDGVAAVVRPLAQEKGLTITLTPIEPDRRLGHPTALSRVLLNLTTNALKFTDSGSVEICCAARGPTRVEFSVHDTGPGINPEAQASLFQPFRRARGRSGYCFSGTGLGLAICRKLVAALGSELQVDTGTWGTRFHFELELPVLPPW